MRVPGLWMLVRIRQLSSSSPLPTGVISVPPAPELAPPAFDPALLPPPELPPAVLAPPEPRPAVFWPPSELVAPPAPAAPAGPFPPAPPVAGGSPGPLLPDPQERSSDSVTAAELRPILATITTSLR